MNNGNILIITAIFIGVAILILLFSICIFVGNINSILYNFKLEMYSINRAGILSINKINGKIDSLNYDKEAYKKYFEKVLRETYNLDENFSNENKLISKVEICEYEIIKRGKMDKYINKKQDDTVLHTVIKVKIKPIILREIFEEIFMFEIHEDVNLNMLKT